MRCWASELMVHPGGELVRPDVSPEGASIDLRMIRPEQPYVPIVAERHATTSSREPWAGARGNDRSLPVSPMSRR